MVAGVSLPIFLPAVESGGRTWTDAVWIKDANLLEAVRRGCDELWVVWCIGNSPRWGTGPLEQYVHMIELSANGALFGELAQIAEINERRARGEAVHGSTAPIVRARRDAATAAAAGPRLRRRADQRRGAGGDGLPRRLVVPRAAARRRRTARPHRVQGRGRAARVPAERAPERCGRRITDPRAGRPGRVRRRPGGGADVVGGIDVPAWGYRPFVDGRVGCDPDRRGPLDRRVGDGPRRRRRRPGDHGDDAARPGDGSPTLARRPPVDDRRR